jgi:dTDP-4-dehydrorhamnose reductase
MKALITGGGGQLAGDLEALLGSDAVALPREQLDITDSQAVSRVLADLEPDVVFNCAAFHNLEACEREPERAWQVNVEAVRNLARRSRRLVHLSTNYVFDGSGSRPYEESDLPSPRSVYALTKLAGEHAAMAYAEHTLVVRTAGLYGLRGSASKGGNFVERMIARAREQSTLRMVCDQSLQPTFTTDLAKAILAATRMETEGIVHLTASGSCSWYVFTAAIMARAGLEVAIEPAITDAGGVQRPRNGVLARPATDRQGVPILRDWDEALTDYMQQAGLLAGTAQRR